MRPKWSWPLTFSYQLQLKWIFVRHVTKYWLHENGKVVCVCISWVSTQLWMCVLSSGTWSRFEEEDLLRLGQHNEAQGAHGLRGDVHGGLPVQRRQHCVLNVTKGSTGQLERERQGKEAKNKWDIKATTNIHITWILIVTDPHRLLNHHVWAPSQPPHTICLHATLSVFTRHTVQITTTHH